MERADLYRKTFSFLIVAAILLLSIFLISLFEENAGNYLVEKYAYQVDEQSGIVPPKTGADAPDVITPKTRSDVPDVMTSTAITLIDNILRLIKIVLWMAFVVVVIRLFTRLLFETVLRPAANSEITTLARTVLSIVIYIVAFFIIFQSQYPQIQLAPLFTGSAILGIVVGLALQDTLGNLFSGLALQADNPFQVGDVVAISNQGQGVIESVSWRGVRIRTFQNKLLVISNAVLGKEMIEVAPQGNLNARLVEFRTTFNDSPAKTAQLVREAVRQTDNVSQKIRPIVRISELSENCLIWEVKYWIENYAKFNDTDALIRQRIWYTFRREGIPFPYPTRTVYMESEPEVVSEDDYATSTSRYLETVPIFAPLSESEIQKLARASTRRVFAPGEAVVRKGQEGGSMFVIIHGAVSVQLPGVGGPRTINKLGMKDFFGEMSLLTGAPRSANVIAEEETEVLQIRKSAIKPLFDANPDLMEAICKMIDERKKLLVEESIHTSETQEPNESGVMRSIKKFFGMGD